MALGPRASGAAVGDHGGSLARAAALFPDAPKPWVDLSTGINPYSYPLFALPATAFSRLPEERRRADLEAVAAGCYGAPAPQNVVSASGTQILLPLAAALVPPGRAVVLSPTYAEHRRAAALAGHDVTESDDFAALFQADLAVVVNPNNPDGRLTRRGDLLELAVHLRRRGGMLVVDEAFMDVAADGASLAADVEEGGMVVLRSFGKFFGLAGVRLGFGLASRDIAGRLSARLGPWAVSGPALEYGLRALGDVAWQQAMRDRLRSEAARLDMLLADNGLAVGGGTDLYRLLRSPAAYPIFDALGRRGILTRNFIDFPDMLRIGLPAGDMEFKRLASALRRWREKGAEK